MAWGEPCIPLTNTATAKHAMAANNEGTPNVTFRRLRKRFAKLTGLHRVFSGPAATVSQLRDSDRAVEILKASPPAWPNVSSQTWDPSRNVYDLAARAQEIGAQVRLQEERDQSRKRNGQVLARSQSQPVVQPWTVGEWQWDEGHRSVVRAAEEELAEMLATVDIDALLHDNDEDTRTLGQLERILAEVDAAHAGNDAVDMSTPERQGLYKKALRAAEAVLAASPKKRCWNRQPQQLRQPRQLQQPQQPCTSAKAPGQQTQRVLAGQVEAASTANLDELLSHDLKEQADRGSLVYFWSD